MDQQFLSSGEQHIPSDGKHQHLLDYEDDPYHPEEQKREDLETFMAA